MSRAVTAGHSDNAPLNSFPLPHCRNERYYPAPWPKPTDKTDPPPDALLAEAKREWRGRSSNRTAEKSPKFEDFPKLE